MRMSSLGVRFVVTPYNMRFILWYQKAYITIKNVLSMKKKIFQKRPNKVIVIKEF